MAGGPTPRPTRGTVTMNDVAARAGVSLKTVSNVVNDYPHIRPATRARVEAAIAELGYLMNMSARNLRRGRTGVIGLAIPDLAQSYFGELADTVVRAADERGLTVLIELTAGRRERELELLASSRRSMTDGLLFSVRRLAADDLDGAWSFPLVLLGERIFGVGIDHVTMANVDGARAATAHLVARGARRIAVVGAPDGDPASPDHPLDTLDELHLPVRPGGRATEPTGRLTTSSLQLRLAGYRSALAEAGLPFDPGLLLPTGPWRRSTGAIAVERAIAGGVDFDAVLGLNDEVALGALHALQVAGVSVPGQVQVIGFDDTDEGAFATPALTSVAPGREEIARSAVDLLLGRIDRVQREPRLVVADYELRLRGTTR